MGKIKEAYYQALKIKGYEVDPVQLHVVEKFDELKKQIDNDTVKIDSSKVSFLQKLMNKIPKEAESYVDPRGIYIYGRVGRGKTFLMDLFYNNIDVSKKRSHYYHFMQDIHTELRGLSGESDPLNIIAKRYAQKYKLLCVDEFHVIDITDAMILYRLLESFLNAGIFFITTSNREPDELYKNGLQRVQFFPAIEIIKKRLVNLQLDTDNDYRMRHLNSAEIWVTGLEDEQIKIFTERFDEVAGHSQGPVVRDINGHKFEMLKVGGEVTWFTFDEACKKPRASQDFIQIASEYDTVFFSGLPVLNKDLQNEVRRFVIMIDEFYDQRIKVVIGSVTDLNNIYETKGSNALDFEFDRTISRLVEMQSETYLKQNRRRM